jgi:hypothetical protein
MTASSTTAERLTATGNTPSAVGRRTGERDAETKLGAASVGVYDLMGNQPDAVARMTSRLELGGRTGQRAGSAKCLWDMPAMASVNWTATSYQLTSLAPDRCDTGRPVTRLNSSPRRARRSASCPLRHGRHPSPRCPVLSVGLLVGCHRPSGTGHLSRYTRVRRCCCSTVAGDRRPCRRRATPGLAATLEQEERQAVPSQLQRAAAGKRQSPSVGNGHQHPDLEGHLGALRVRPPPGFGLGADESAVPHKFCPLRPRHVRA